MKLTTKTKYTIEALTDLVNNFNGKPIKLKDISIRKNISLHYLEQLFRKLRQAKIVKSIRGPKGGYVLATSADKITLSQILFSIKENVLFNEDYFHAVDAFSTIYISQTTLADIVNFK